LSSLKWLNPHSALCDTTNLLPPPAHGTQQQLRVVRRGREGSAVLLGVLREFNLFRRTLLGA